MRVAPVSWWITHHVQEGRSALNFSEWQGPVGDQAREAAEAVAEGSMPPGYYTWAGRHPDGKLTKRERDQLAHGLANARGGGRLLSSRAALDAQVAADELARGPRVTATRTATVGRRLRR